MSPSLRERLHDAKSSIRDRVEGPSESLRERVPQVDREDAKRAVRRAAEGLEDIDHSEVVARHSDADERETLAAAEDASTMAPPVDASLRPTTSPEDIDGWVTGTGRVEHATDTADDVRTAAETGPLGFQIDEDFGGDDAGGFGHMEDMVVGGDTPGVAGFEHGFDGFDFDGFEGFDGFGGFDSSEVDDDEWGWF